MNDKNIHRVRETVDAVFLTELVERDGAVKVARALGMSDSAIRKNVADKHCSRPIELAAEHLLGNRADESIYVVRIPAVKCQLVLEVLRQFGVRVTELP